MAGTDITIFKDQELLKNRQDEFAQLLETGKFSDLKLKSSDGYEFKVHKNILATTCSHFRKTISGEAKFNVGSKSNDESLMEIVGDVHLTLNENVEKDILLVILIYLYTGEAKFEKNKAKDIFTKAKFYDLKNLQTYCSQILEAELTKENLPDLYKFSVFEVADSLRDKCIKFYSENVNQFEETFITNMTVEEIIILLTKFNYLREIQNQENLFSNFISWIKIDIVARDLFLMRIMDQIDFNKISDNFIQNVLLIDPELRNNNEFLAQIMRIMFQRMKK